MSQKPSLIIPEIDVVKIIERSYFESIKRKFLSLDHIYFDYGTYEDGKEMISNPDLELYQIEIMSERYDEQGDPCGDYIFHSYNFYLDYFNPGIEKGKSTYLLNLKKEIKERINHKDVMLVDLFSYKKVEINSVLVKNINKDLKSDLQIYLEKIWNSILDEINLLEEKYFPSLKLNLSLSKSESLLLFHSLYLKGVFSKDTTRLDLGRFIDRNITYKKGDNYINIKNANDDLTELLPAIKTSVVRQPISNVSRQRLDDIEEGLFSFLDN
ncbi:hypothetical protein [Flavobacterium soyangense]|uniref:Uncharacterized protein n=1 Tax=Flavobacterium soyangense TaxID=2023265 RepID=A0A930XWF3_9FLAO|nr:hypothetical protein [Flavobacterium soyangense]MBF2709321.1 hypothetical protein [Flavobacterium soyangense]